MFFSFATKTSIEDGGRTTLMVPMAMATATLRMLARVRGPLRARCGQFPSSPQPFVSWTLPEPMWVGSLLQPMHAKFAPSGRIATIGVTTTEIAEWFLHLHEHGYDHRKTRRAVSIQPCVVDGRGCFCQVLGQQGMRHRKSMRMPS